MSDPFIGEIRLFPFDFAPRGWAWCHGQLLPISQHTALFALIGTIYGGDGRTTFALPDLRGRVAVSAGQGPGLDAYDLGEPGGSESVSLDESQLAAHTHRVSVNGATSEFAKPNNRFLGRLVPDGTTYAAAANGKSLHADAIAPAGEGEPHENRPPYLALHYCIALEGIFPARN
jgi:microcystin-dependent protein